MRPFCRLPAATLALFCLAASAAWAANSRPPPPPPPAAAPAPTSPLVAAQRHDDAALRLNPQHLGALEYAGQLALMKNDLPTAEARLAVLNQVCRRGCEELESLKNAIARFKADDKPVTC